MTKTKVKNAFKAFTKFTVILPMILVAAILSFTACNKDEVLNPHNPDPTVQYHPAFMMNPSQKGFAATQVDEFLIELLEGRIAGIEYSVRVNNTFAFYDEDGNFVPYTIQHFHYELLDEISKPGEVWFYHYKGVTVSGVYSTSGYNRLRYKLENDPVSGGVTVKVFEPLFSETAQNPYQEEPIGWKERTGMFGNYFLTSNNGLVYKFFKDNAHDAIGLNWVYANLLNNKMFKFELGVYDELEEGKWQNYNSNDALRVMEVAYSRVTFDDVAKAHAMTSFLLPDPYDVKITRK